MAALECGRITEAEFVSRLLESGDWPPEQVDAMREFRATWFAGRVGNRPFIDYLRTLRERGVKLALLTNNVREWEPLWRATLPSDLFDVIVNSAHEGVRKPEPEIYRRLIARLEREPEDCLFVDDLDENCEAAAAAGLQTLRFADTEAAISEIDRRLAC
jgi:putative hydrolase of the HAD superfamily